MRSDTVTQPTPEMRRAMADAELGDDVFGEDPTVNRLQKLAAERLGKEEALLVASGTMGNLIAVLSHCGRGEEMILGDQSHIILDEAGGAAALGGVSARTIPNLPDGTLPLKAIRDAIRDRDDLHQPASRLLCLGNTQNMCGGVVLPEEYCREAAGEARRHGLAAHLDGARIFNASVALGVEASVLAAPFDSVMFCLSKGLCAPVGSMLCGSRAFVEKARRVRKQVGGGMRQAGVIAAAGILSLIKMAPRLGEDHAKARLLADGIRSMPGIRLNPESPQTNMVFFDLEPSLPLDGAACIATLAENGVLALAAGPRRIRLVTHYWIREEDVRKAVIAMKRVFE